MSSPPHDENAEMAVLGAILNDTRAVISALDFLVSDDFYLSKNATIFQSMVDMFNRDISIDEASLFSSLNGSGKLDQIGGMEYIGSLSVFVSSSANIKEHARVVKRNSNLRRLISIGQTASQAGHEAGAKPAEILDKINLDLLSVSDEGISPTVHIKDTITNVFNSVEEAYNSQGETIGLTTGFTDVDRMINGLSNEYIVLAARASMGKSQYALNLLNNICVTRREEGRVGVMFNLEMSKEALTKRFLATRARIDSHKLKRGTLDQGDWNRLTQAAGELADSKLYLQDGIYSLSQMKAETQKIFYKEGRVDLIVIDYIQLITPLSHSDSREREVAEISRFIALWRKQVKCPIIVLAQLNRAVEMRQIKKPQLSDLRECVVGDTLVVLSNGLRVPIRDLVGTTPDVLSISSEGKVILAKSDMVWPVGKKPVFEINLASGRSIICTENHRLLGFNGWVYVKNIAIGSRLAIARELPEPNSTEEWEDEKLILLGQLIGDGSYLKGQPLRYTTMSEENSEAVRNSAEKCFNVKVTRYKGRRNWHQLLISGNGNRWHPDGVNLWLRNLGIFNQRSHQKRIPQSVFRLSNKKISLLLKHLWATDGSISVSKNGTTNIGYATNSEGLAKDIHSLLLRLGIVSRTYRGQKENFKPSIIVSVSGSISQKIFLEKIWAFGPRIEPAQRVSEILKNKKHNTNIDTIPMEVFDHVKNIMREKGISQRNMAKLRGTSYGGTSHFKFAPSREVVMSYAEILNDDYLRQQAMSDIFWDKVTSITYKGEEEVFDLTVPDTSSWLADGIISHNSGALEQDADIVMFLYRPEYYDKGNLSLKGQATLSIAKQRDGATGDIPLVFFSEFGKFENASFQQH